jgi:hypothetical protein
MSVNQYPISIDQLVYDYGSMISAVCIRMMQSEDTAQEAAQEIWLEVMKSLPSFKGRSKLSTWLYTIAYAAVLVDTVSQLDQENILEKVTQRKKADQAATGKMKAAHFGITSPEAVFTRLAEIFDCASWEIRKTKNEFVAETKVCKLCAIAKKTGSPSPCYLYCLDPMEGMVRGLNPDSTYTVEETLWEGGKCRVRVNQKTPH